MKELFDYLARKGLTDERRIESAIMHDWRVNDIIDFNDRLLEKIPVHPAGSPEVTNFEFVTNSSLSAHKYGDCIHWDCRVRRIDSLSRFAALYSDHVYVNNYFDHYPHSWGDQDELKMRYDYVGDLKVLLTLKPLLESGIVCIINDPTVQLCPSCFLKKFPSLSGDAGKIKESVPLLAKEYTKKSSASVVLDSFNSTRGTCDIYLKTSEDIVERGEGELDQVRIPKWLLKKINSAIESSSAKYLKLSNNEFMRLEIIQDRIEMIASDVLLQQFCSRILGLNAKYLTNRTADISLLQSLTINEDLRQYHDILSSQLLYKLPILQNAPLEVLLSVRANEHDAFLVYRNTISKIIKEYILANRAITASDAQQINEDIIYPKLCELNAKMNSIKSAARKKAARNATIIATALTIGLFGGIIPEGMQGIIAGLGGLNISKDLWDLIEKSIQGPQELRSDNFYYLWKLTKKKS